MEGFKRKIQVVTIILLALFLNACLNVRVIENIENPDLYFKKAYSQIEEIHRRYPDRDGKPDMIHILIYEGSERKVVKITTPIWLANGCMDLGMWAAEREREIDFEDRYDFDWSGIKDLRRIGSGLLVEIENEKDRILIWMK